MLKCIGLLLAALASLLLAHQARAVLDHVHRDFSGDYALYGGFPDDIVAPVAGDTKVAFRLKGTVAKAMFDGLGPDLPDSCPNPRIRLRNRDMLLCRYYPKDGYRCDFGFDLSTGLSIGGAAGGELCKP